jgi:hypothetical protein
VVEFRNGYGWTEFEFHKVGEKLNMGRKKEPVVEIPLTVYETAETKEDLEDWLISKNPEFVKRMRKARRDDLLGRGTDWNVLKKELCIK